jgi:2-dehydropantoate 2-reductase
MRTLIVGAGAVGGYFGGRLALAGKDVTFLVRPPRRQRLESRGLRIREPDGTELVAHPALITAQEIAEPYDLVLLCVKAYALDSALADLAPAIGSDTVIVPFLNGMRHIGLLEERFGRDHVYGGTCFVASMLDAAGDVVQLNGMQQLSFGPLDGGTDPERLESIRSELSGAGFPALASNEIVQEMWEKWCVLAGLGAITCLMRGTIGAVNSAPDGPAFTRGIIDEVTAISTAAGFEPREGARQALRDMLSATDAPTTSSMYRDLVQGEPVEGDQIVGDLVRRADSLGVRADLLRLANTSLAVYSASRGGSRAD